MTDDTIEPEAVSETTENSSEPQQAQRGVFLEVVNDDEIVFHPINVDPLAISAIVLMASNLVKKSLGV